MMQTIFSTDEVHPRERFDSWHSVTCRNIIEHNAITECRRTFRAELSLGVIAETSLVLWESSSMDVSLSSLHAARANPDELFVCRQIAGHLTLEQSGRDVRLDPGDITLLDPRLRYAGRFSRDSKFLLLKIPRRQMEARVGKPGALTAYPIRPTGPERSLTSAYLAMLPAHTVGLSAAAQAVVQAQVLDLIGVSLSSTSEARAPGGSSARAFVSMKVRAAIEAHLADRSLDTARIAAAAGVSVRYANAVLAENGTSIARLIQTKRLQRCRQALDDPSQSHRTLTEIAYGWGFSDMTHFGRKFRAAFGTLPSEYRHLAKSPTRP